MAHVITLKTGENVTMFGMKDFEFLVEKHLGHEALDYFHEQKQDVIEGLKEIQNITSHRYVHGIVEEMLNALE